MQFTTSTIALIALTSLVAASPLPASSTDSAAGVLTSQAYADFQISSGTAGSAEDEANALFADIDMNDLANVASSDLDIINSIHDKAEDAETDAFDPEIDDASDDDTATALQNGKIKNKVLKLTAEVLGLQIEQAQGDDKADDIAEEQTKLATNIKLDEAASGQTSTAVDFTDDD